MKTSITCGDQKTKTENGYLVGAAGVLELASIEARAAAKEVVNLTRLHVVWETGDEERVDVTPVILLIQVIWIEWLLSHLEVGEEKSLSAVVCDGDGDGRRRDLNV